MTYIDDKIAVPGFMPPDWRLTHCQQTAYQLSLNNTFSVSFTLWQ